MSESIALVEAMPITALSDPLEDECLVNFVYVYPTGQLPPYEDLSEAPDDFDLANSHFEDYQHEWSRSPQVGDTKEWQGFEWNITAVYPYLSDDDAKVYVAICAQDTSVPQQEGWGCENPLLYLPILLGGEIATNEDGSSRFGLCDRHADIPTKAIFEDWEFSDWQRFKPIGPKAPQEFREIVLCWCVREPAIIAA